MFRNVAAWFGLLQDVSGLFKMLRYASGWFGMFRDISHVKLCSAIFTCDVFGMLRAVSIYFRMSRNVLECCRMFLDVSGCFGIFR